MAAKAVMKNYNLCHVCAAPSGQTQARPQAYRFFILLGLLCQPQALAPSFL